VEVLSGSEALEEWFSHAKSVVGLGAGWAILSFDSTATEYPFGLLKKFGGAFNGRWP